jgi:hypothetical protein
MSEPTVYYSPETLEALRANTQMSEGTWHKIMNPLCGACAYERGLEFVRKMNNSSPEEKQGLDKES